MSGPDDLDEKAYYRLRDGTACDVESWSKHWDDVSYRFLAHDLHEDGEREVKTIWNGLLILPLFSTGFFHGGALSTEAHAKSEAEAWANHRMFMEMFL